MTLTSINLFEAHEVRITMTQFNLPENKQLSVACVTEGLNDHVFTVTHVLLVLQKVYRTDAWSSFVM